MKTLENPQKIKDVGIFYDKVADAHYEKDRGLSYLWKE